MATLPHGCNIRHQKLQLVLLCEQMQEEFTSSLHTNSTYSTKLSLHYLKKAMFNVLNMQLHFTDKMKIIYEIKHRVTEQ
jgi:hypothetical protein